MKSGIPFVDTRGDKPRTFTLLFVDDEDDIRAAVSRYLKAALPQVDVIACPSGPAALDVLKERHVDVILTDYRMPGMDGLEFLEKAKSLLPEAPRLMLTAYPDVELASKAVNEEAVVKFLTKPIDPARLAAVLRDVIERVHARDMQRRAIEDALGHRT